MIFINLTLIDWYLAHGRALPWRCDTVDYHIWLSEIILQQTRVNQGLNYYKKFKKAYPTIHNLAQAPLDEVLKLWQGLGYYTRARNLHATAKYVSEKLGGTFPADVNELRRLKGVGEYTAAAIASIVYKIPVAVVDGNVSRVLSRLYGIFTSIDSNDGKKQINELAQQLLDKNQPDVYNQAIMDFGALVCTPKKASCDELCPFNSWCYAYNNGCVYELPMKSKSVKQRVRYFYYLIIKYGNKTYIHQRLKKDIWHSLYEFPLIETEVEIPTEEIIKTDEWSKLFNAENPVLNDVSVKIKHQLSHQTIWCRFLLITMDKPLKTPCNFIEITLNEFEKFSVPRLIESYIISDNMKKFFRDEC